MFTYLLRAMATRPYTVEGQHDCYESDWRHAKSPYMVEGQHECLHICCAPWQRALIRWRGSTIVMKVIGAMPSHHIWTHHYTGVAPPPYMGIH